MPPPAYMPSLADAEVAEDLVEEVFDGDSAGDLAEAAQRQAEVFGAQFGKRGGGGAAQCGGGVFERLAVAGAGQERGFATVALRDAAGERGEQSVDALAGERGDLDWMLMSLSAAAHLTLPSLRGGPPLSPDRAQRWIWQQVDLVGDEDCVGAGPSRGGACVGGVRGVEDEEADLGFLGAAQGAAQALLLDKVVALAQARGIGEQHRIAAEVDRDFDDVAGRAGDRRGDRRLAPGDAIEEA